MCHWCRLVCVCVCVCVLRCNLISSEAVLQVACRCCTLPSSSRMQHHLILCQSRQEKKITHIKKQQEGIARSLRIYFSSSFMNANPTPTYCELKTETRTEKGKAFPLQAWTGPWGFQEVEAPEFLDNRHRKVVRSSVLCTGRLYPQERFLVLIC